MKDRGGSAGGSRSVGPKRDRGAARRGKHGRILAVLASGGFSRAAELLRRDAVFHVAKCDDALAAEQRWIVNPCPPTPIPAMFSLRSDGEVAA